LVHSKTWKINSSWRPNIIIEIRDIFGINNCQIITIV
jgi:hypothetical protein